MSSTFLNLGSFPDVDLKLYDGEVIDLYRNRDLDVSELKQKPFNLRLCTPSKYLHTTENRSLQQDQFVPVDPNYYQLTEAERIEGGLKTKFDLLNNNFTFRMLYAGLLAYSLIQFDKIYSPAGVILRNTIKVSWSKYLS